MLKDRIEAQLTHPDTAISITADEAYTHVSNAGFHILRIEGYDPLNGGPPAYIISLVSKDGSIRLDTKPATTLRDAMLQAAIAIEGR